MDDTRTKIVHAINIGEWKETPEALEVNSNYIEKTRQSISVSMEILLRDIEAIPIVPSTRKKTAAPLKQLEIRNVSSVAGKIGYVCVDVSTLCALTAS